MAMDLELLEAVIDENLSRVEELLSQGANPNIYLDEDKVRPLHFAAQYNAMAIAELLIFAGADVHAKTDPDGYTPIDIARLHGHDEMVELLEKYESGVMTH